MQNKIMQDYKVIDEIHSSLKTDATRIWFEIEEKLKPKIQKYNRPSTPSSPVITMEEGKVIEGEIVQERE